MDFGTIATAVSSSLGLSIAGVYWVLRKAIEHRLTDALEVRKAALGAETERLKSTLTSQLEERKAVLQRDLAQDKAEVEGAVRREVELALGERAAERQYELEARRRLYLAIGPLRLQLLLACRDVIGRIEAHCRREAYAMNITGYYGRSTLYRLLRPLAIAELIERQIAYSDFSVDRAALDCLRFKKSAIRIFSGDEIVLDHPRLNWNDEVEHAYMDSLRIVSDAMICNIGTTAEQRVLRFDEFVQNIDQQGPERFAPFPRLLNDFTIQTKPILWLRLVAYANTCNRFIEMAGAPLGFETMVFPVLYLIEASGDPHITDRKVEYEHAILEHVFLKL